MFQTFDSPQAGADTSERVARLRELMAKAGVDAVLVPRSDQHQGEYVAPCSERLAWLTGFTGSAGLAVVARNAAAVFVDGRYTVQARAQVDGRLFELLDIPGSKLSDWLERKLSAGAVVGFDPWLHSAGAIDDLTKMVEGKAQAEAAGQQPGRSRVGQGAARAAQGAGRAARAQVCRQAGRAEDQRAAGDAAQGRPGCGGADAAGFDCLAAQHSRLGCGAQSGGAGVRDRAGERQAGAVRRQRQDRRGGKGAPCTAGQDQRHPMRSRRVWRR